MAVMMGLGPFRFSLVTAAYQTLDRNDEYRWVSQERIDRHPAMQYVGPGHTSFSLAGVIYPHFRGGIGQVEAMRQAGAAGQPHVLVSGLGRIFGQFVIISIDETQTIFFADGTPRKQEFNIELKSYGADGGPF